VNVVIAFQTSGITGRRVDLKLLNELQIALIEEIRDRFLASGNQPGCVWYHHHATRANINVVTGQE
jgi:hypothetical protein